jgi:uncharacterized protein (DUF1501 family)
MAARPCHCADFSRSQLLHAAAAEAGRGLPAIEQGMPLPAGTGLSRRGFLLRSAGLALSVYGAGRLGARALEEGIAQAATGTGPVVVSIFLEGGADSLSLLYPAGDANYSSLRPTLALPATAGPPFSEDERLHWHPALEPLATLHGEGKVTTLPAVGYTRVDQSHFTSRHYWEVGATDTTLRTGWLGRYLDGVGSSDNPLQGLSLDGHLQPALATATVPVAAIDGPNGYRLQIAHVSGEVEARMFESLGELGASRASGDPALAVAGKIAVSSVQLREELRPFGSGFVSPVSYPDGGGEQFPQQLATLAAVLAAGLPLHCVAVSARGRYDTHANQADGLARGLELTAATLLAFQRDLEARGLAERVLVHVWSEFGRRAAENGSAGTDHGAAGTGFLIGSKVRGQMIGEFPGLMGGLDENGNLKATSDFRGIYCAVLEQWLGTDAAAVIPNAASFTRPELLR